MIVGSIKENVKSEKRISVTLETAKNFIALGLKVILEKNYSTHLGINDKDYENLGVNFFNSSAEVLSNSDLIIKVNCPNEEDLNNLKEKQILIGMFNSLKNIDILKKILQKKN